MPSKMDFTIRILKKELKTINDKMKLHDNGFLDDLTYQKLFSNRIEIKVVIALLKDINKMCENFGDEVIKGKGNNNGKIPAGIFNSKGEQNEN